ncbi:MAG: hypothetical protein IT430_12350 [Phycisphaerales bacterium]|nr:hypothetical protein [Phycisphaerales bacterium]
MGRLISFLACGVTVGFFAGAFQIPNMIPIMLVIFWLGMGAGLRLGYALVGAVLMPLAVVAPMWFLPGPTAVGRMYPPDDSQLAEMFIVRGADEVYAKRLEAYEKDVQAQEQAVKSGLVPLPKSKPSELVPPTLHDANTEVLSEKMGHTSRPEFDIWPRRTAWAAGLLVTILAFAFNTVTTRPFREARPLGQA